MIKKFLIALLPSVLFVCSSMASVPGYSKLSEINLDNTVGQALSNQQLTVVFSSTNFTFSVCRTDGYDVRFTDSDMTTLLSYKRVAWDKSAQTGTFAVKVPTVGAGTTNKKIYCYYGKSSATDVSTQDALQKYPVSSETLAILHFDEGTGTPADSTGNRTPAAPNSLTWAGSDPFGFSSGSAGIFNGTDQAVIVSGLLDTMPSSGTIMGYWYPTTLYDGARVMTKWFTNGSSEETGIDMWYDNASGKFKVFIGFAASSYDPFTLSVGPTVNNWYHVAITWQPTPNVDGEATGLPTPVSSPTPNTRYDILINGVRVASVYKNLLSGSTKYPFCISGYYASLGSVQAPTAARVKEWVFLNRFAPASEVANAMNWTKNMTMQHESERWRVNGRNALLSPSGSGWDADLILEPSVIDVGQSYWLMAYTGLNGPDPSIGIAHVDTTTFVVTPATGNPKIGQGAGGVSGPANGSCIVRDLNGDIYDFFQNGYGNSTKIQRIKSTDGGSTFSGAADVISSGDQGWLVGASNPSIVYDTANSRWVMILSNFQISGGFTSQCGIATATTLSGTWSLATANPMTTMQYGTGSYDGRTLAKDSTGTWHVWGQAGVANSSLDDLVLTENFHWSSPSVTANTWTKSETDYFYPALPIAGEVVTGHIINQLADPIIIAEPNRVVQFYDLDTNSGGNGVAARIDYVTFSHSLDYLIAPCPIITMLDMAIRRGTGNFLVF